MSFFKKGKEKEKEEELEMICILSSGDLPAIAIAKSILMDANIEFINKNEYCQNLFGFGNLGGLSNPLSGPVEIYVKKEDAEVAKELLENLS